MSSVYRARAEESFLSVPSDEEEVDLRALERLDVGYPFADDASRDAIGEIARDH